MLSGTLESHLEREACKKFNAAPGRREICFRKRLCSDVRIYFRPVHDPLSSRLEVVVAPPIS